MLPFYGGTMVELYCIPAVANFHHEPLAGTLKQCWLFTDPYWVRLLPHVNNVRGNRTLLAMPG